MAVTPSAVPALRGLVLAGGHSERMGVDKASIEVQGRVLLDRTVDLLNGLVDDVHVSVRADQAGEALRSRHPLILDAPGLAGPVAGLVGAWRADAEAAWLVVACDMPGLDRPLIEALIRNRAPARAATAWRSPGDGLPEPLCAIWEPATLARLAALACPCDRAAQGDEPRVTVSPRRMLAEADALLLTPDRAAALLNVNTPAELDRFRELTNGDAP